MPTLYITRGISGSGKSTWARSVKNAVVVSRDDLRAAMFGTAGPEYYAVDKSVMRQREDMITKAEHAAIKAGLSAGFDVVSDNTHTMMKYVNATAKVGYSMGANVELKVFDVPLQVAVGRVKARAAAGGLSVPQEAISRQWNQLKGSINATLTPPPPVIPYTGTPGKPKAFLVDIDGTLAHMGDKRGPFDWKNVGVDDVDQVIADIVSILGNPDESPLVPIVMSGRDESSRNETDKWLKDNYIYHPYLFMRPQGDMRADNIVKHELFNKYVRENFDVQFVLDDRQQVVDMWRAMGITCLQVAPGDF